MKTKNTESKNQTGDPPYLGIVELDGYPLSPQRYRLEIATLGDTPTSTTCSMLQAKSQGFCIKACCGSFEDAIALVKEGKAQAALVPGAYPGIGKFLQDPELFLARCFAAPIPALVLAAKPEARPPFHEIHAHPATKPFWSSLDAPVIEAASNDSAAAAAKEKSTACITNEAAAESFGLRILHVFRPSLPMSWNLFVRNPDIPPSSFVNVIPPVPKIPPLRSYSLTPSKDLGLECSQHTP